VLDSNESSLMCKHPCISRLLLETERLRRTGSRASKARVWMVSSPSHSLDLYTPDKRTMLKIKHERDCDCVVAGFRWHKEGEGTAVGSLLLGLYNDAGKLQHVGVCASFTTAKRGELVNFLARYRENALNNHPWADWADEAAQASGRMPGGKSRWSAGKDLSWQPLRIELVVEVAYEHMQGDRFRHLAHFRRWRPDKPVEACTYEQLEVVPPQELMSIFPERT
jgi:ATP-dependent DNA ligase